MAKKFKTNKKKSTDKLKNRPLPITSTKWVDFNEIKLWDKNPRRNDKSVKDLALLLAQYGQRTPLSVWEENKVIYKGNTTYKALKYLHNMSTDKFAKFTKDIENPYLPGKVFIALMNFENEREAELYGMSDNKSGEWSDWDETVLAQLTQEHLGSVSDKKKAFMLSGFKDRELNELLYTETQLPGELPKVDLQGTADVLKADYCIIEMPSKRTRLQFMETIGVDHFRNRVIKLDNLVPVLTKEFVSAMQTRDVGDVDFSPQRRKEKSKQLEKETAVIEKTKEVEDNPKPKKKKFKVRKK